MQYSNLSFYFKLTWMGFLMMSNSNHKGEKLYYIQFYIILHFIL
jgi:hypothetical protein